MADISPCRGLESSLPVGIGAIHCRSRNHRPPLGRHLSLDLAGSCYSYDTWKTRDTHGIFVIRPIILQCLQKWSVSDSKQTSHDLTHHEIQEDDTTPHTWKTVSSTWFHRNTITVKYVKIKRHFWYAPTGFVSNVMQCYTIILVNLKNEWERY